MSRILVISIFSSSTNYIYLSCVTVICVLIVKTGKSFDPLLWTETLLNFNKHFFYHFLKKMNFLHNKTIDLSYCLEMFVTAYEEDIG